jgi:hypothetical protein
MSKATEVARSLCKDGVALPVAVRELEKKVMSPFDNLPTVSFKCSLQTCILLCTIWQLNTFSSRPNMRKNGKTACSPQGKLSILSYCAFYTNSTSRTTFNRLLIGQVMQVLKG